MTEVHQNGVTNDRSSLRKGSDPLGQTVRGKLQNRRQKLNHQINKEMRMRAGAENLYRAATNKKLKEQVALELSFVNSNLQLLKEELAALNSDMESYQNESIASSVPMIPLGLKETKDVDFTVQFKDFILEHYSQDGSDYDNEIKELMNLRNAIKTPTRNSAGIELLFEYYNQLYFVENRFFPPNRHLGIYFHWYDSLTGIPSAQKTVAFEKGSILFNIGSLYTQIGARQDRSQREGIAQAIDNFQMAAGTFKYLMDNFSHAPSKDMNPAILSMLMLLMLAQSQECIFEKKVLGGVDFIGQLDLYFEVSQESVEVCRSYLLVKTAMQVNVVKDYIPYSWLSLVEVKLRHYKGLAHYYLAMALLSVKGEDLHHLEDWFSKLHPGPLMTDGSQVKSTAHIPKAEADKNKLAKAHLQKALLLHEESIRTHRMCKMLRKIDTLQEILRHSHDRSMNRFSELEQEDDFYDNIEAPEIEGKAEQRAHFTPPDFSKIKVKDIFHRLGPLAIFSARNNWSAPREVYMTRNDQGGYGFTVRGDSPVIIASLDEDGVAARSGVLEGDFIVSVGGVDVKWNKHEEVVNLILNAKGHLKMQVVTPQDKDFLHPQDSRRFSRGGAHKEVNAGSGASPPTTNGHQSKTQSPASPSLSNASSSTTGSYGSLGPRSKKDRKHQIASNPLSTNSNSDDLW